MKLGSANHDPVDLLANNARFVAGGRYPSFSDKTLTGESFRIWKFDEEHLCVKVDGQKVRKYRICDGNGIRTNHHLMAYLTRLCQEEELVAKA